MASNKKEQQKMNFEQIKEYNSQIKENYIRIEKFENQIKELL